jgi:hypothetical protein
MEEREITGQPGIELSECWPARCRRVRCRSLSVSRSVDSKLGVLSGCCN